MRSVLGEPDEVLGSLVGGDTLLQQGTEGERPALLVLAVAFALFRRLVGLVPYVGDFADWLPIPYHFDFTRDGQVIGVDTRRPVEAGDRVLQPEDVAHVAGVLQRRPAVVGPARPAEAGARLDRQHRDLVWQDLFLVRRVELLEQRLEPDRLARKEVPGNPGRRAVMTGRDLPAADPYYGHALKDRPILAIDRVRFVGAVGGARNQCRQGAEWCGD